MRKSTLGRKRLHIPILKVLGYTVKVKHGTAGYKSHEDFRKFIEVEDPEKIINFPKVSTNKLKTKKRDAWYDKILKAQNLAFEVAENQKFECVIIPKFHKTAINVKLN